MKYIVTSALAFMVLSSSALAYQVTTFVPTAPYEVYEVDGFPEIERVFLGELQDFPEMYQIQSDVAFLLTVTLDAVPGETAPVFSGIVIRDVEGGVEEVARLRAAEATWDSVRDPVTRLERLQGPTYQAELPAGTYRIEVSTPDNQGKYWLTIGHTRTSEGYIATVRHIATVYDWYGASTLAMLRVPLVIYPLGIVIVLALFIATWYWRRYR